MLRSFRPSDFARLQIRDEDSSLRLEPLLKLAQGSFTVTLEIEGEIVSIGGLTDLGEGVATIWQVPSKSAALHLRAFCKVARQLIEIAKILEYKTLITDIKKDKLHTRWAKHIGFYGTGTLGPKEGTEIYMRRID